MRFKRILILFGVVADGRKYRDCYAERILERANEGEKCEVVIPIPTKKKK